MRKNADQTHKMQDVLDVAPSGLVPATLKSVKGKRAAARSLVGDGDHPGCEHSCAAIQEHENELAEVVIVCEPEGTSLMMGGLHPRCRLFRRRPIAPLLAPACHPAVACFPSSGNTSRGSTYLVTPWKHPVLVRLCT